MKDGQGFGYPAVGQTIENSEEQNKVLCQFCQWICDTNRDSKCPGCGSPDYKNNFKIQ
jgi:rubrerythrin